MSEALTVKLALVQERQRKNLLPHNWEDLKNQVVQLREAGRSVTEIERVLHLTRHLVRRALADMGRPMGRIRGGHYRLNIPKERIQELIGRGWTRTQIEKELGISNRGLLGLLARYGLTSFDPHEKGRKLAEQGHRRCADCREIKLLEADFYSSKSGSRGKEGRCKMCSRISSKLAKQRRRREKGKPAMGRPTPLPTAGEPSQAA